MKFELQAPFHGSAAHLPAFSKRRTGFDPGLVQVKFVETKLHLARFSSQYFGIFCQQLSKSDPYSYATSSQYNSFYQKDKRSNSGYRQKRLYSVIGKLWTQTFCCFSAPSLGITV